MIGTLMSTCTVDVTIPPMIGAAIGFMTSAPTPVLHEIGTVCRWWRAFSDGHVDSHRVAEHRADDACHRRGICGCHLSPGHAIVRSKALSSRATTS